MAYRSCISFRIKSIHKNLFGLQNVHQNVRGMVHTSGPLGGNASNKGVPTNLSEETHTGQKFDKEDYRNVRFTNKSRLVNTRFAIKLIDEEPPKPETKRVVWCEGGGGPLGHPRVYINLDKPGNHICGYCGLRFYKDGHHH